LLFAAANAKFTDERIEGWPKGKEEAPLGQLPYLTVDGIKLPQSASIARYVAKEFSLAGILYFEISHFMQYKWLNHKWFLKRRKQFCSSTSGRHL